MNTRMCSGLGDVETFRAKLSFVDGTHALIDRNLIGGENARVAILGEGPAERACEALLFGEEVPDRTESRPARPVSRNGQAIGQIGQLSVRYVGAEDDDLVGENFGHQDRRGIPVKHESLDAARIALRKQKAAAPAAPEDSSKVPAPAPAEPPPSPDIRAFARGTAGEVCEAIEGAV